MSIIQRINATIGGSPLIAVSVYMALLAFLTFLTADAVIEALERRDALVSASELLQRLEAKDPVRLSAARTDISVPKGSPFLEGPSPSVAAAALLQRVTAATKRVNGNILSSQVDLQGPRSKTGFISATFNFEVESASLQPLLYDLEAGMPFLFVDQLVVQASSATKDAGRLRVLLGVSGLRAG
jgi:general secretion pathway protein M